MPDKIKDNTFVWFLFAFAIAVICVFVGMWSKSEGRLDWWFVTQRGQVLTALTMLGLMLDATKK